MIAHCNPIINFDLMAPLADSTKARANVVIVFNFFMILFITIKNVCFLFYFELTKKIRLFFLFQKKVVNFSLAFSFHENILI